MLHHLAVAAAVIGQAVVRTRLAPPAARAFGLGFVPVAWEPYDLVIPERTPVLEPLFDLLADGSFAREVEALGGYDASEMGDAVPDNA